MSRKSRRNVYLENPKTFSFSNNWTDSLRDILLVDLLFHREKEWCEVWKQRNHGFNGTVLHYRMYISQLAWSCVYTSNNSPSYFFCQRMVPGKEMLGFTILILIQFWTLKKISFWFWVHEKLKVSPSRDDIEKSLHVLTLFMDTYHI